MRGVGLSEFSVFVGVRENKLRARRYEEGRGFSEGFEVKKCEVAVRVFFPDEGKKKMKIDYKSLIKKNPLQSQILYIYIASAFPRFPALFSLCAGHCPSSALLYTYLRYPLEKVKKLQQLSAFKSKKKRKSCCCCCCMHLPIHTRVTNALSARWNSRSVGGNFSLSLWAGAANLSGGGTDRSRCSLAFTGEIDPLSLSLCIANGCRCCCSSRSTRPPRRRDAKFMSAILPGIVAEH